MRRRAEKRETWLDMVVANHCTGDDCMTTTPPITATNINMVLPVAAPQ